MGTVVSRFSSIRSSSMSIIKLEINAQSVLNRQHSARFSRSSLLLLLRQRYISSIQMNIYWYPSIYEIHLVVAAPSLSLPTDFTDFIRLYYILPQDDVCAAIFHPFLLYRFVVIRIGCQIKWWNRSRLGRQRPNSFDSDFSVCAKCSNGYCVWKCVEWRWRWVGWTSNICVMVKMSQNFSQ